LPGNGFHIEATMGTGFKAPSFFALGNPLVGNPQLRPEESRTAELAVASAGATAQRIALFRTRYTNLVDFDAGPPPRLVNRAQVDIRGVEYAASVRAGPWAAHASATALSFDVPGAATPLRNRPKFKAAAGVAYDAGGSWSAGLHGAWRGRLFDSAIPTGGMYLQPDFIVDGSVSYALRDARISVVVDNILTRDYEQFIGFPAPRRRVRLEVALPLMRKG
jgi:outer membrane cobalamin receptor